MYGFLYHIPKIRWVPSLYVQVVDEDTIAIDADHVDDIFIDMLLNTTSSFTSPHLPGTVWQWQVGAQLQSAMQPRFH